MGVLGILAFATVRSLQHEYAGEVAEIMSASDRTAQKLATRTTEVLDRVNQATLLVKYLKDKDALPRLSTLRDAGVISDDVVQFIYIADRRGFVIDTTAGLSAANVADEDFFKRHRRESDLDVAVASVWIDPINGAHGIPVTRRLSSGTDFQGVITATVNPAALSVTYARSEPRGTAIGVMGTDGVFRSRTLDGKLSHGERADPARVLRLAAETRTTGGLTISPIDGRSRFLAATKVDKYPLYAVVAVDAEHALAAYRHTRERVLIWAAAVAVGVLLAGWIVLTQVRRLDASRLRTKAAEAAFRATLEGSLDAVTILRAERDAAGALQDLTVIDCNTLAASLVGVERDRLLGQRLCCFVPSVTDWLKQFDQVIRTRRSAHAQVLATEPRLAGRWLHHQLVPLDDGVALITRDVTEKRLADEALAALARCDGLTQLSNRRHFEELLEAARARALRSGEPLALIYIDLDGFKAVNDSLGHAAGDAVLVEVAQRLKTVVRETDVVARLGGDEFVVLAERAGSLQDVHELCDRVLDALRPPHRLAGRTALATPSIGAAIFDERETAASLRERADAAMYLAKTSGKSRYVMATLGVLPAGRPTVAA